MFPTDLTLTGSEFQRSGAATGKANVRSNAVKGIYLFIIVTFLHVKHTLMKF